MQKNSLIIFKSKPAKVLDILDKKIEIETLDGKKIKLPPKNVHLLVENKLDFNLKSLEKLDIADLEEYWQLLQEQQQTSIEELCEVFFEKIAVNEAYTVWILVLEGEYFSFNDDFSINIHSTEQKEKILAEKAEKHRKEQELANFINRLKDKEYLPEDEKFIKEIVALAYLKTSSCRFFKHLNMEESENNAYKLLLDIKYWDEYQNPHLYRYGAELEDNPSPFEYNLDSDINRVDLTNLKAYAIDDEGSNDPDDAISWDNANNKMWVHVADPSSSIEFDSKADLEARARGSNLYVPEKIVSMLPPKATDSLGLGLNEISPALSIGFKVNDNGDIKDVEIHFSKIKVTRLTYDYAEKSTHELELGKITTFATKFTQKRINNGAVDLDFPEVKITVSDDKKVRISDLPKLKSRTLVRDAMLMAGVAVGDFCIKNNIYVPFSTQPQHELTKEELSKIKTLADMFSIRKKLHKGEYSSQPDKHSGLGLDNYVQVTSPLRRYLDLITHYQLRRFLNNKELLSLDTINKMIAQVHIPIMANRQTERYSNLHWKLVYLMQNPNSEFKATIIELLDKNRVIVSIDKLAMTKKLTINEKLDVNKNLLLLNTSESLINQEAFFNITQ